MKTVLITGASSGIGMAFARAYAERNCRLIITGRRLERLQQLSDSVSVPCRIITADLSDEKQCFDLLGQVKDEEIDVFINNAGFGAAGSFLETDIDKEISMARVNDIAMHILFKGILKQMSTCNQGTILNVASSAGLLPGGPYMAGYYASKAYMVSLTRAVARELKEAGSHVHVHALCPGPVDTEFNDHADVVFALKGISPEKCVAECLKEMERNHTIIVPTLTMKAAVIFGRLLPPSLLVRMVGHQQKKKL